MTINEEKLFGGRYQSVRLLGKGSSAIVYLVEEANQTHISKKAMKWINVNGIDESEKQYLIKEASLLSEMQHQYILQFHDSFFDGNHFAIVTEYCNGGDLSEFLKETKDSGRKIDENQIGKWIVQLLLATAFMHEKHVLHRDLKTSNIFLQNGDIRVGDFGICRLLNSTQDLANTFVGTPYYMSPEVLTHEGYNNKSDIWSLGVILYEMCTQKRAFAGTSLIRVMWQVVKGPCPKLPSHYSVELQSLLNVMLTKDPSIRPSASNLLHHSFVEWHMRKLIKDNWLLNAPASVSVEQQLETLKTMWMFPDEIFNSDEISEPEQSEVVMEINQPANKDFEDTKKPEIDLKTLTPRQRIRMNVHTESDIVSAELREMAEQYIHSQYTAPNNMGNSSRRNTMNEKWMRENRQFRQLPQEHLLKSLHHLALKSKNGTQEESNEDIYWSYTSTNEGSDPFSSGNLFDMNATPCLPQRINSSTSDNQRGYTNTIKDNMSALKRYTPEYWRTYTDLIPNKQEEPSLSLMDKFSSQPPNVSQMNSKENFTYDRLFIPRTMLIPDESMEHDLQAMADILHDLDKNNLTCGETLWDETELEDTLYTTYTMEETTIAGMACPDHDAKRDDSATLNIAQNNAEEEEKSLNTLDQLMQCMKMALKENLKDTTDGQDATNQFQQGTNTRQQKITDMRRFCIHKLGKRMFDAAHNYLYEKRIIGGSQSGEVAILTGLRSICPDVTTGFVLDQLIFLEHREDTSVSPKLFNPAPKTLQIILG